MSVIHVINTTTNPASAPARVGQHWTNTANGRTWIAVGIATVGDWKEVGSGGGGAAFIKYTIGFADLAAAALTNNFLVLTLPIKTLVTGIVIKTTAAFTGGAISAYNLTLGITGNETKYLPTYDGFAAVAGGNYDVASVATGAADIGATEALKIFATSVGANLNAAVAGSVDVYLKVETLP